MTTFDAPAYWEDRLKRNAGVRGIRHTDLGAQYNLWLYRVRRAVFHRAIYSLQPDWSGIRVLDVGSGTGFYMRLWKGAGVSAVTGSDLTGIAVSRLRESFPAQEILRLDIGAPFSPFFVEELGRFQAFRRTTCCFTSWMTRVTNGPFKTSPRYSRPAECFSSPIFSFMAKRCAESMSFSAR